MRSFVRLNNKRMEIFQEGELGVPILILTGMGCSFEEWFEVTEALSKTNKILMFHRPGLGESEIGEENRTTSRTVKEINELLNTLQINEPIILVGHSYGGLCAQQFTKLYPSKVKTLILVDSTSVELGRLDRLEDCSTYANLDETELKRIIHPVLTENQKKLPLHVQQRLLRFQQTPNLYKAMKSEVENWKADARIIKKLGQLPNIPLLVIGRDKKYVIQQGVEEGLPESELMLLEETWEQLIEEQAELSKSSRLVFAENSGHSVHLDRPDLIIEAVKNLVEDTKSQ
ncbi:alpha/beta fold hydrolase [Planococcus halocryophilus]|uniref:alpha/beta fold hydrolase n=1 Tax=Planococcus halocryophilus TaxID=1215089 RepID=UPI001F0E6BF0|nr:alpha/beta hydrolase [Planococcus halocryophilus]MCH4825909.1 alpha/beta hydrolase [Planococcus halocryophilus]